MTDRARLAAALPPGAPGRSKPDLRGRSASGERLTLCVAARTKIPLRPSALTRTLGSVRGGRGQRRSHRDWPTVGAG
jgi:hypothetical protein